MKIAQVAPLIESVPPKAYGGTERVVSYLTEALVELGHDVTLFASGDSQTAAQLVPVVAAQPAAGPAPARLADVAHDHARPGVRAGAGLRRGPLPRRLPALSAGAALPDAVPDHAARPARPARPAAAAPPLPRAGAGVDLATASASRSPMGRLARHGASRRCRRICTAFIPSRGDYFAFVGRISPEKRVDRAIEIAQAARRASCASRPRSTASTRRTSSARSRRCSTIRWSSSSARSTSRRRTSSSATHARCCFRSTGPSRSAW